MRKLMEEKGEKGRKGRKWKSLTFSMKNLNNERVKKKIEIKKKKKKKGTDQKTVIISNG